MGSAARLSDKEVAQLRQLVAQQREELTLVGCELHDGMLQYVVAAHLLAEALRRKQEQRGEGIPDELIQIRDLLQLAMQEGRRLLGGLQPMDFSTTGFAGAVRSLVQRTMGQCPIAIEMHEQLPQDLSEPLQQVIYRLVQESLHNVVRHAKATEVKVDMTSSANHVVIRIADNGCGFDPSQIPAGHFGVTGMQRRAQVAGGTCRVVSQPGEGTQVECRLPRA